MNRILKIFFLVLSLKLIYLLYGLCLSYYTDYRVFPGDLRGYADIYCANDCYWYKQITEQGYEKLDKVERIWTSENGDFRQSSWAFFPLYPFINYLSVKLFSLDYTVAAFIPSLILTFLAFYLFYLFLITLKISDKKAWYGLLFFSFFPFHFYFSMYYTESLFLALVLLAFLGVNSKNKLMLISSVLLLPLTRVNGIIVMLPLVLYIAENKKIQWNRLFLISTYIKEKMLLIPFLSFISFFAWSLYQYNMTGSFKAFSLAQKGWFKTFQMPYKSLFDIGNMSNFNFNFLESVNLDIKILSVLVIMYFITAVYQAVKVHRMSLNLFIFIQLLLPLTAGSVISSPRYASVIFPLFYPVSNFIYHSKLKYIVLFLLLILQLIMFHFFLINEPISY